MEQDEVTKEDVARVITRSRVCPESWVGKVMCCSGQMHQVVQERMIQLDQ